MSYLLHIDTSGDIGTVALSRDGDLAAITTNNEARNHAAAINVMIDEVISSAGIVFRDISAVVVCAGPGSYTGLRIGLSSAKGICYALGIPLILDNKLTLLAFQAHKNHIGFDRYITVLKARENEFFIASYDGLFQEVHEPKHITRSDLGSYFHSENKIYIITDCLSAEDITSHANIFTIDTETSINIKEWLSFSLEEYKCNNNVNLSTAEPFYLKQVYTHK